MPTADTSARGLPLFSRDAGLAQQPNQQVYADVLPVWAGQNQSAISSQHEFVLITCEGTFKPQSSEALNQFAA